MATAKTILQNVGKNFLNGGGLDHAVRVASQGKFHDMDMVIGQMVDELYAYYHRAQARSMTKEARIRAALKAVCGVDLTNTDTGSALGLDAGSGAAKTAASVIADAAPKQIWPNGKTTTIKGLTINAPAKNKLTAVQQNVVQAIYNRWSAGALDAMEQALGVSFATKSANLGLRNITISFTAPTNASDKAYWNHQMMYAVQNNGKLYLYVNLANREIRDWANGTVFNKKTGKYEEYMDRMLAREYSRIFLDQVKSKGLMDQVNLTKMRSLYELVGGADDTLSSYIKNVVEVYGERGLSSIWGTVSEYDNFQVSNSPDDHQSAYSYLSWRYCLKKSAEFINNKQADSSLVWGADGKSVTIGKNYKGVLKLSNDTAVITGYDPNRVKLIGSEYELPKWKYRQDVKDLVILWEGREDIRIKNVLGKTIKIYPSANATNYKYYTVSSQATLPQGTVYANAAKSLIGASSAAFGGTLDGRLYTKAITIDLRGAKKATTIYGNAASNTIYASQGGSKIYGLGGNDTLSAGAGKDTFYVGTSDGTDVVKGYNGSQDVIRLTSGKYTAAQFKSHVTLNKANGEVDITNGKTKVRILDGIGQKITVYGADNKVIYNTVLRDNAPSFNKKNGMVTLNKNYTGTMDLRSKAYASASNVNAAAATHKVTLYGNGKNNTLTAGKAGSVLRGFGGTNTLVGGAGTDTFYAGKGEGNTVVKDFAFTYEKNPSAGDILQLTSGTQLLGGKGYGRDLWLDFGNGGTAKIINGFGKYIKIRTADGKTATRYWYANNPANTYYDAKDKNGDPTAMRTRAAFSGTLDMRRYRRSVTTVDAKASTKNVDIYGTEVRDQNIYASRGGGKIYSMSGTDKIYCNNGADQIYFGRNYGQDTVYTGRKNDIVYLFDINNINQVHGSKPANGVMKLSFTGRSDTLSLANWNANTGLNTVQLANKQKYRINANGTFKKI